MSNDGNKTIYYTTNRPVLQKTPTTPSERLYRAITIADENKTQSQIRYIYFFVFQNPLPWLHGLYTRRRTRVENEYENDERKQQQQQQTRHSSKSICRFLAIWRLFIKDKLPHPEMRSNWKQHTSPIYETLVFIGNRSSNIN